MFLDWIDWKDKSIRVAVLSAVLSAVVSVGSSSVSVYVAIHTQSKQISLDLEEKLNQQNGLLTQAGGAFIAAVNSGKDLSESKIHLNSVLDGKISQILLINKAAHLSDEDIIYWKKVISDLIKATNEVKTADQMPQWAEQFGKVIDVDQVVSQRIIASI